MIGDRLTRSTAARFLWGGLVLLCLIGLFVTRSQQTQALNAEIQSAQDRATRYANTTIADQAIVDTRAGSITFDKKDFEISTEGDVFTDPTVVRLRVWNADGKLLVSTDPADAAGQLVSSDPLLTNALNGSTAAQVVEDDGYSYSTVGAPRTTGTLLESFTPFRVKDQVDPVGAVQVDFLYPLLEDAAASPWETWTKALIALAALFAALFVLSLVLRPIPRERRPVALSPDPGAADVAAASVATPSVDPHLEDELQVAREQLQQASEAFAFLEAKMKDGASGHAMSVDVDAAMTRIAELEAALQRAEADAAAARDGSVSREDVDKIRRDADQRVAEMERLVEEASKPDPELEELRKKLADAEERATRAETALSTARAAVSAARQEVEEAAPSSSVGLIEELEAKVAEAEERAREAEEEALRVTPEATDLRAKLAQAAARKKLGSG
jgi:hypothetical protein